MDIELWDRRMRIKFFPHGIFKSMTQIIWITVLARAILVAMPTRKIKCCVLLSCSQFQLPNGHFEKSHAWNPVLQLRYSLYAFCVCEDNTPVTNWVQYTHCRLWLPLSSQIYGPSARHTGHISKQKISVTDQEN